jgi:hypothetical protein
MRAAFAILSSFGTSGRLLISSVETVFSPEEEEDARTGKGALETYVYKSPTAAGEFTVRNVAV